MRLLQFKPKKDPSAAARMGALIAGGRAVLDLPATLDSAGRGGWLPAQRLVRVVEPRWHGLVAGPSSVEAAQRADDKTVEQWKKNGKVFALEDVEAVRAGAPAGQADLHRPQLPGPRGRVEHGRPGDAHHLLEVLHLRSSAPRTRW